MRGLLARKIGRLLLTGTVLGAGMMTALLGPTVTSADIDWCRDDPIVTMVNADGSSSVLVVNAAVATSVSNVSTIYYDIHVPATVQSWTVSTVGDISADQEVVSVTPDLRSHHFRSTISIISSVNASVTASEVVGDHTVSRSGTTGKPIHLRLVGGDTAADSSDAL